MGDPTQIIDCTGTTTFGVVARDRLTSATYPNGDAVAYAYDATGNEPTKAAGGVTTTCRYDPLERLTGITGPTAASYPYNGDGLRAEKTSWRHYRRPHE